MIFQRQISFITLSAFVLMLLTSCTPTEKASDTVEQFLKVYQSKEGNPNSFLNTNISEPSYENIFPQVIIEELDRLSREFSYEIENEKKQGDQAEITVVFKTNNLWKMVAPSMQFQSSRPSNRSLLTQLQQTHPEILRKKVTLSLFRGPGGWTIDAASDPELPLALHGNIPLQYETDFSEIQVACGVSESLEEDPDVLITYKNTSYDKVFSGKIHVSFIDRNGDLIGEKVLSADRLLPGERRESTLFLPAPPFKSETKIYAAQWTFFDNTSLSTEYDLIYQEIAPISTFYLKVPDLTQQKASAIAAEFKQNYEGRNVESLNIFLFDERFAEPIGQAPKNASVVGSINIHYDTGIESVKLNP